MTDIKVVLGLVFIGVAAYLGLLWELADNHIDPPAPPYDTSGRPKAKNRKNK